MFAEPYSGGDVIHHTPGTPDEQPGASPEIFPSPDFDAAGPRDANVERCTRCRSMVMQAWNQYGTIWPVVHQQLGVRPDLGRGRLEVVPQLPPHQPWIGGANIRLGDGAIRAIKVTRNTTAARHGQRADPRADDRPHAAGRVAGRHGHARRPPRASREMRTTNRGVEVTVTTRPGATSWRWQLAGRHQLRDQLAVVEDVERHDAVVDDGEGEDRERASPSKATAPAVPLISAGRTDVRETAGGHRVAGEVLRAADLLRALAGVGAQQDVGVEDGDEGVEVALARGGEVGVDDRALAGEVGVGRRR